MEILLLWSDDAPGPDNAKPRNALIRCEEMVLHEPQSNKRARATQSCKTVHGECAIGRLGRPQEAVYDGVARCRAIDKEEVVVLESGLSDLHGSLGSE